MPTIPDRQPITDSFSGVLVKVDDVCLLAPAELPGVQTIASGRFVIHYAVPYLGKPHLAIVPGLVALDYGEMLTGEAAWDFLLHHSNLHPRADVVGYRNDGTDDMIVVKLLDLALPVQVLVYTDASAVRPLAHVMALIAPSSDTLPTRLLEYLPRYNSLEEWPHHE